MFCFAITFKQTQYHQQAYSQQSVPVQPLRLTMDWPDRKADNHFL
jgi:hypothetical protein